MVLGNSSLGDSSSDEAELGSGILLSENSSGSSNAVAVGLGAAAGDGGTDSDS